MKGGCAIPGLCEVTEAIIVAIPWGAISWTGLASLLKDLALASVAIWGLQAWRRQLKGTTEYQVAHKVLRCTYYLRDAVMGARENVIFPEEKVGREPIPRETDLEKEAWETLHAYHNRLKLVLEKRTELHLAELDALALWGDEAREALEPLFLLVRELHSTYRNYFYLDIARAKEGKKSGERSSDLREMHAIIYRSRTRDKYGEDLDAAVKRAEEYFRKLLR